MPKDFESLLHEWKALKLEEFRGREHLRKHWKRSIRFAFEKREYLMNWLKDYNLLDNVGQQRQNMLYSARLADYACKRDRTLTQYYTILKNEDQLVRRRKKRQIYDEGPQAAVDPQGHLYYMRVGPLPRPPTIRPQERHQINNGQESLNRLVARMPEEQVTQVRVEAGERAHLNRIGPARAPEGPMDPRVLRLHERQHQESRAIENGTRFGHAPAGDRTAPITVPGRLDGYNELERQSMAET